MTPRMPKPPTAASFLGAAACASLFVAGSFASGAEPPKSSTEKPAKPASALQPTKNGQPKPRELADPLPKALTKAKEESEALPIDLAGVLELARASNLEIRKAQEKVVESQINVSLAKTQWLPSLNLGTSWLKHEGRTQDIPGQIITTSKAALFAGGIANAVIDPQKAAVEVLKAKQQMYANSGALDRATRQSLQDASQAYIDLVAAQAGVAMSVEISSLIEELVHRSEQLLKQGVGAEVEVLSNKVRFESQRQRLLSSRRDQLAAGAQLVQLLHLPAMTRLYANEEQLAPLYLVDENRTESELVDLALSQGPGLAEVASLVTAMEEQKRKMRQIIFLPTITASVGQGTFGGGFGGTLSDFGSSTDIGVSAYWDVMRFAGTGRQRELFESKRRQVSLQQEEVNNKIAAGVVVARHTAIQAKERISMAENEIKTAIRAYQLSQSRLQAAETTSVEVMQAIGNLGAARANYLQAVIDYNRAQVQLQYLLGTHTVETAHGGMLKGGHVDAEPTVETIDGEKSALRLAPRVETGSPAPTTSATAAASTPATPVVPTAKADADKSGQIAPAKADAAVPASPAGKNSADAAKKTGAAPSADRKNRYSPFRWR